MIAPAKQDIFYGIQILRGLAALLVVIRHSAKEAPGTAIGLFEVGQFGVDIFFVISGFVIYLTGRKLGWKQFAFRRIIRIVPLYWLALVISIAADVGRHGIGPFTVSNAVASFFFLPAFSAPNAIWPPIVVGWSLNFEMYFYLIFALVLALRKKLDPLVPVALLIIVGIVLGSGGLGLVTTDQTPLALLLLPISIEFLAGMWLARRSQHLVRAPLLLILGAVAVALIWLYFAPVSRPYTIDRYWTWGVPAVLIVAASIALEKRIDFSRWKSGLLLGNASYALYLFHLMVIVPVAIIALRFVPWLPAPLVLIGLVLVAVPVGIFAHLWIELPVLKKCRAFFGVKSKGIAVSPAP